MKINVSDDLLTSNKKISCIYVVTNLINNRKYVGQTTNLRKRVSDYRHADKKLDTRPITLDIKRLGIENFEFSILELCDENDLSDRENYYIEKLNTKEIKYGYNLISNKVGNNSRESRINKSLAHIGLKESNDTKRKKSNYIFSIDDELTTIIISDSGKLFGDLIGESKDYVKALLRNPTKYNNIFCFYDDYNKRQDIRNKLYNKQVLTKDNVEYLKILDYLDHIELNEGVETIYLLFDVFVINYENKDANNKPILKMISDGYSSTYH